MDVTCAQALRRELARIGTAAGVCGLVAASMRQGKGPVAAADGRQLGREINESLRDEVDHLLASSVGDVRLGSTKQVASLAGEGSVVASEVWKFPNQKVGA
jgi:hypothetical protein